MAKQKPKKKSTKKKSAKKPIKNKSPWPISWMIAACLAITFVCLFPTLQNGFTNWDDLDYVTENRFITRLNVENVKAMFTQEIATNYHPLTMLSLALNFQISKLEPWSYHWLNMFLHLANTALVFLLIYRLFGKKWEGALIAALLFGIHPMHVESVAWISERKDVLYTLFFLLGLLRYLKYIDSKDRKDLIYTGLFFLLSLLSKPTAVIFPAVLVLLDFWRRDLNTQVWLEKLPFFLLSLIFGYVTIQIQSDSAVGSISDYGGVERIQFVGYGTWYYIQQFFVPFDMATFHPYPERGNLPFIYPLGTLLTFIIAGATIFSLKWTKAIFVGMAIYVGGIILTLQFIQVGSAIVSERYTYLSYIGLSIVLVYCLNRFAIKENRLHPAVAGLLGLWICFLAYSSFQQSKVWENSETLWSQVISVYPNSSVAYNNLGNFLSDEARNEEALIALNKAIELKPNYSKALNSRGKTYRLLGRPQEALVDFNQSIQLDPNEGEVYSNRGNVYFDLKRYDLALADYNKSLSLTPDNDKAIGNSGSIYFQQGNYPAAIEQYSKAIQLNAAYADAYLNRGASYAVSNQSQAAIADFSAFLQLNQNNWRAWYWRALEYQKTNQHQLALNDLNAAIQLIEPANKGLIQQAINQSSAALGR